MASGREGHHTLQNEPGSLRRWRRLVWVGVAVLLGTTACGVLDASHSTTPTPGPVELSGPAIVVTVGGLTWLTPTPGVAPTIPDSTPLPRIELPTRDPAAPAASPPASAGRPAAAAAARAAQPPPIAAPVAARSSPAPVARR
jgi:hypothetical protein